MQKLLPGPLASFLTGAERGLVTVTAASPGGLLLVWPVVLILTATIESFLDPSVSVLGADRLALVATLFVSALVVSGLEAGSDLVAHHRLSPGTRAETRVHWVGIFIAVACVILSRALDFRPGYLFGIVGAVYFIPRLPDAPCCGKRAIGVLLSLFVGGFLLQIASAFLPAALADPERVLEWYFPWEEFEYTGDQQGGLGATLYFQEKMGIQSVGLNCVVTDWVEQETIAFEMTEGPLLKRYAERWAVEDTPTGSRFTLTLDAEFEGRIINALVGPFAERGSGANVEQMLTRLKLLAEKSQNGSSRRGWICEPGFCTWMCDCSAPPPVAGCVPISKQRCLGATGPKKWNSSCSKAPAAIGRKAHHRQIMANLPADLSILTPRATYAILFMPAPLRLSLGPRRGGTGTLA